MAKQIMVIGLGQFGMSLVKNLSERGAEILAVDKDFSKIEAVADFVAQAVAIDATDEAALTGLLPVSRDSVVCAIGEESRESAIICTALLRQMGCKNIIARANDETLQRILKLVGAHEVINPELEFGRRFATHLLYRNIVSDTALSSEMQLSEVVPPPNMVGKKLMELRLPKKFGIIVASIRRKGRLYLPNAEETLQEGDSLLVVSNEDAIRKFCRGAE